ncbi:hypothetical protein LCGC14_1686980 [marine sediment metagenome]|uniref:Uncharacterized protein n=1 Tax=marine sediment metagenome TaxID=412755 RepID=A0A0F9K2H7_9ZZZZ
MAETIIVVGHTEVDGYGNLWVTPQGGGEKIKIAKKRESLHPIFQQGQAVQLDWQTYNNKPYVANAKSVAGALPQPVPPPEVETPDQAQIDKDLKRVPAPQEIKHDKKDKAVSLSYAKDLACAKLIGISDMRRWADEFLKYIEGQ